METIEELQKKVELLQLKIKVQELEAELSRREAMNRPVMSAPYCNDPSQPYVPDPAPYRPYGPYKAVFDHSLGIEDC
jgi:hypothetical protein